MIISVDLYTRTYEADLTIGSNGETHFTLLPESKRKLEEYLKVVLPHYIVMPEKDEEVDEISFEELMRLAAQWQRENPEEKLSEPMVLLPYQIPTETKAMLQELANAEGISMSQYLVRLIDKNYDKVVMNDEK